MKLQVGDIVRYLNDVGGGEVKKILDSNMVEILDESGFLLPVKESDLVLVERKETVDSMQHASMQTHTVDDAEDDEIEGNEDLHLLLAFIRDAKNSSKFHSYLINDCNYHVMYLLSTSSEELQKRISSGLLEANTKIQVAEFAFEDIEKLSNMHLQGIFYKNREYQKQAIVDIEIDIKPVKFYKPGVFVVNDFFDEDAYVIDCYDAFKIKEEKQNERLQLINVEQIKEAILQKKDVSKVEDKSIKIDDSIREIDLHIHELVDDETGMSAVSKLELQIKTFETDLAKAVADGVEKIVFIHGVGNGILKAKIRGILDRDYPQYFYQDASFQRYKFGATLVYLRKVYK